MLPERTLHTIPSDVILCGSNKTVDRFNLLRHRQLGYDPNQGFSIGETLIAYSPILPHGVTDPASGLPNGSKFLIMGIDSFKDNFFHYPSQDWLMFHCLYRNLEISIPYLMNWEKIAETEHRKAKMNSSKSSWDYYFAIRSRINELKLNYAITVHKSQGSTYQTVGICNDFWVDRNDKSFNARLWYVALSRAKSAVFVTCG